MRRFQSTPGGVLGQTGQVCRGFHPGFVHFSSSTLTWDLGVFFKSMCMCMHACASVRVCAHVRARLIQKRGDKWAAAHLLPGHNGRNGALVAPTIASCGAEMIFYSGSSLQRGQTDSVSCPVKFDTHRHRRMHRSPYSHSPAQIMPGPNSTHPQCTGAFGAPWA